MNNEANYFGSNINMIRTAGVLEAKSLSNCKKADIKVDREVLKTITVKLRLQIKPIINAG